MTTCVILCHIYIPYSTPQATTNQTNGIEGKPWVTTIPLSVWDFSKQILEVYINNYGIYMYNTDFFFFSKVSKRWINYMHDTIIVHTN